MPFENLTGDSTLNWFGKGISSLIINGLGKSEELSVCDDPTLSEAMHDMRRTYTAGMTPSLAKELAARVRARAYISGSFQGRDNKYWIMANLVNTKTGKVLWTSKVEGNINSSAYLSLADSLCMEIRNYLELKALKDIADSEFRESYPTSSEAYRYFIDGMNMVLIQDYEPGIKSLKRALAIDSTFALAQFYLTFAYYYEGQEEETFTSLKKAYLLKDHVPYKYQLWIEMWYACFFGNSLEDVTRFCDLLVKTGLNTRLFWWDIGITYHDFSRDNEKAASAFEKVMEINREMGSDWKIESFYTIYGSTLHKIGKHEEEMNIYDIGLNVFQDNSAILARRIICLFSQGDTITAGDYLNQLIVQVKKAGAPESRIEQIKGNIYSGAGIYSKAEFHLRKAYDLESKNPDLIGSLANLLIDHDIDIDEGLELVAQGLEIMPNGRRFLLLKGIGCYKQGRYNEAVDIMSKEWERSIMSFTQFYHYLPEARQALANQSK